jgi:hypothetical protein
MLLLGRPRLARVVTDLKAQTYPSNNARNSKKLFKTFRKRHPFGFIVIEIA